MNKFTATSKTTLTKSNQLGLRASSRIPLADALIAASAASLKAVLVHRDPHFQSLPTDLLQEKL
jgi:predicted nucleic acid-binding protein